jgi:ATP-dependent Clp protease ATP-binding subunit ClpB
MVAPLAAARAGVNVPGLKRDLEGAMVRLPKVEGHGGDVSVGRDLGNLLNLTDKEAQKRGDQFIASEMFLLALCDDKGETGRLAKQHGLAARRWKRPSWRCAAARASIPRRPKASARR